MLPIMATKLGTFVSFAPDEVAAIRQVCRTVREVAPRRDLIREGDAPRHVHLVLDGWACRYKTLPDGRRQIVSILLPGDLFDPDIDLLATMDHSIGAITRLRVAELARSDLDALATSFPRVTRALSWQERVAAAIQREWTLNLGQRTAYERIAHLLMELFLRLKSAGLTTRNTCELPLTQNDIAETTGLTAVHVNRTIQELRRSGLIVLEGRRLTIPNIGALQAAALFNPSYLHLGDRDRDEPA